MNKTLFDEHLASWRNYYIQQLAWENDWSLEQAEASIADTPTETLMAAKAPGLLSKIEEQAEEAA